MSIHESVLLDQAVDALMTRPQGNYVDCTYGRGGHSQAIVGRLGESGRLLVIDRDKEAIDDAILRFTHDSRVTIVHGSYSRIALYAKECGMSSVDGILLDLGVSSPQLASPQRGFSFSEDGPLDMRMDQGSGVSASEWLASASEKEITRVLRTCGEERFARRIARKIVEVRQTRKIDRTGFLVEVIESAVPKKEKNKHPATRSFQAIRIHINRELEELKECLADVIGLLASGGRLVVISFHSLEDRIVKQFIRKMHPDPMLLRRLPVKDDEIIRPMKAVGKAIKPDMEEIQNNRRARSAIMRIAEKT